MPKDRYIDNLSVVGGNLRGTAQFVNDQLDKIRGRAKSRKLFGPNREDFDDLVQTVKTLSECIYELGQQIHDYDLYILQNDTMPRHPRIQDYTED